MLWEARAASAAGARDPTRGLTLMTLSLATSLDALAVGLSMALLGVVVWLPCVVTGIVTAALSAVGTTFGGQIGPRWEHWAEAIGGMVLIAMGAKALSGSILWASRTLPLRRVKGTGPSFRPTGCQQNAFFRPKNGPVPSQPVNAYGGMGATACGANDGGDSVGAGAGGAGGGAGMAARVGGADENGG